MKRLWVLGFLFLSGFAIAADICDVRNIAMPSYPLPLTLRTQLCATGVNQNGYLSYEVAKASSQKEVQWVAQNWSRSYGTESKAPIEKIINAEIANCNNASRDNVVIMMLFRKKLYLEARFFGNISPSKQLADFSNDDAKAEDVARVRANCGVDLGKKDISWQILDQ